MNRPTESPRGVWWRPAHRAEKVWVGVAFGWCMVLFAMMPLWHFRGGQNPAGMRARVNPQEYLARTMEFIDTYKVGEASGLAVVEPPPGSDVYLLARMWSWMPVLQLREGVEYTLHLSSLDVNHGFSLMPGNMNFQVVPGYDYALKIRPNEAGEYRILCNEFCGIGHHTMMGRILVLGEGEEAGEAVTTAAGGAR